jgi:PP-loop superfamily ATP-utilizing enzyme
VLSKDNAYICTLKTADSVAQLVEQYTFNVWALGSNPSGITRKSPLRKKRTFFVLRRLKFISKSLKMKKAGIAQQWTFSCKMEDRSRDESARIPENKARFNL